MITVNMKDSSPRVYKLEELTGTNYSPERNAFIDRSGTDSVERLYVVSFNRIIELAHPYHSYYWSEKTFNIVRFVNLKVEIV
jgi:hypothetical protein